MIKKQFSLARIAGARLATRDETAEAPSSPRPGPTMPAERPIEPMLAVYEARAETLRIVVAAVARASSTIVEAAQRGIHALRTRQPNRLAILEYARQMPVDSYATLSTGCEAMPIAAMENTPEARHPTERPYSEFVWEALGATPSIQFASEQRASTHASASNAQATAAAK